MRDLGLVLACSHGLDLGYKCGFDLEYAMSCGLNLCNE